MINKLFKHILDNYYIIKNCQLYSLPYQVMAIDYTNVFEGHGTLTTSPFYMWVFDLIGPINLVLKGIFRSFATIERT